MGLSEYEGLSHPKRPVVGPLVQSIKKLLAELEKNKVAWGSECGIEPGVSVFVASTISQAEAYMLVTAAVNTIVVQAGTPGYSTHAQEILDISAKKATGQLPDVLKEALQRATAGQVVFSRGAPKDTAEPSPTTSTAASNGEAPPAKRAKAEVARAKAESETMSALPKAPGNASTVEAASPDGASAAAAAPSKGGLRVRLKRGERGHRA